MVFHQRDFAHSELAFAIDRGRVTGRLVTGGRTQRLEEITGVYMRLMDDRELPELEGRDPADPMRAACRRLHEGLTRWAEIAPARVVNRMAPMGSNFSKPYQAQLITAAGFATPHTLVTADPEAARAFLRRHGRVIYKSVSGMRSIVREVTADDEARLDRVRWCPTQFQAFAPGRDVRVHVIGREVYATAIDSTGVDYRYAGREEGGETELTAVEIDPELAERCRRLALTLGLDFAGIDLRLSDGAGPVCFEVNPCPAFSYYEANTRQPIARAVARHLLGPG
jgi:glutathione synthase/RimK-type ligase-like ATP-grasp enzyme